MVPVLTRCLALVGLPAFSAALAFHAAAVLRFTPVVCYLWAGAFGCGLSYGSARCTRHFLRLQRPESPVEPGAALDFLARLATFHVLLLFGMTAAYTAAGFWLGELAYWVSLGAGLVVYLAGLEILAPSAASHRGRRVVSFREAARAAARLLPRGDPGLSWGGLRVPSTAATNHWLVLGATGSGKTLTLRLLAQSVLPAIGPGSNCRALIYDAKQDVLSTLYGMGVRCPVKVLHPFDLRAVAWDIARDCTAPATALQIASILIPEEEGPNRFFSDAARHLLAGVLVAFARTAPGAWTFRDVLLALKSKRWLRHVLGRLPETEDLLEYFAEERTFQSIYSTLASKLAYHEPIAAAWSRAQERVSLLDWVRGEYILVLGNDEAVRSPLDAVNQVLFKRLTELLLGQADSDTRRTWVILDEVREAGRLDGLGSLLTKGRSKGVCVVLGFQDIEGLREVYGDKGANEIAGQCGHKAILRLESPETAAWSSQVIGECELYEYPRSRTSGRSGGTKTVNEQLVKREGVLPSQFLSLPPTNPTNGLSGYYLVPLIGAFRGRLTGKSLGRALRPRASGITDFLPRPEEHQYLVPWTEEDLRRLSLSRDTEPPGDKGRGAATPRLRVIPFKKRPADGD